MRIKKMVHKADLVNQQLKEKLINQKKEKLFRSLAVINVCAKLQKISYYHSVKDTNFSKPKIKAKADQIEKFSEDIITSLGDAVRLKEEFADYMEYEHFTELYELATMLFFIDTESIKNIAKLLRGEIKQTTEGEFRELINT